MSKKRRVFQVARELSLSNEAVIDFLAKLDKTVHTQMSAVSDNLYTEICSKYKADESSVETPQDFRKQLKEKQMLEELRRNKARLELEERLRFATKLAEERPERTKKAAAAKKAKEEADALKKEKEKEAEVVEEVLESSPEEISVVELISKAKKEIDKEKAAADTVVTSCPSCVIHLESTLKRKKLNINVRHIVEVIDGAMQKQEMK